MNLRRMARTLTLTGYFGLLGLLLIWNVWLAPSSYFPRSLVLIVLVVPLLLPLRGLLHGRVYTHMWTPFLALVYFILGMTEAVANPAERHLAAAETILSLMLFFGAVLVVRLESLRER